MKSVCLQEVAFNARAHVNIWMYQPVDAAYGINTATHCCGCGLSSHLHAIVIMAGAKKSEGKHKSRRRKSKSTLLFVKAREIKKKAFTPIHTIPTYQALPFAKELLLASSTHLALRALPTKAPVGSVKPEKSKKKY